MRTLLKSISTGLYFQGPDKWTSDPTDALNFKSIDRAVQFVERWALKEVELAFAFQKFGQVKSVPIEKTAAKFSED
ncbi:conserved hypothetical protein [Verrucomicrobia bacterium]|nr:conserved hypothetical protein [Verrucomicrobiota bacterium]